MSRQFTLNLRQFVINFALVLVLIGSISFGPAGLASAQPESVPTAPKKIVYIFYGADVDATAFKGFLESLTSGLAQLYTVDLFPLGSVSISTDFSGYDMLMIADDTGSLNTWGTPVIFPDQVARIVAPGKPILGIGEGGYAFFGKLGLFLGWPHGWHGPQDSAVSESLISIFGAVPGTVVKLYNSPPLPAVNAVGIYISPNLVPPDVTIEGKEPVTKDHSDQIEQNCHFLWGNSGAPDQMTAEGKSAFANMVAKAMKIQCALPPPPPTIEQCISLKKFATPSGPVAPGDVITYELDYTLYPKACVGAVVPDTGTLVDPIPVDTTYVPGSATGGGSLDAAGNLNWAVSSSSLPQTQTFKVIVSENQCVHQKSVNNTASLNLAGFSSFSSNTTTNAVTCPPVLLPNSSTFYAEDEVQVNPYPLIKDSPSQVSVRLVNSTSLAQSMTAQFQVAPLGIGQVYTTFNSQPVTLPPFGTILLTSSYTPAVSGQASFQVLITTPSQTTFTQSNLDVSEDFIPGHMDSLIVPLRNNTPDAATATNPISLVVDNTCPGWSASVTPATLSSLGAGASTTVQLDVTPPVGPLLGTGCHIDLQAWMGSTLIGGIRKLDIAPVHLPSNVIPPWEEPEISFSPNPPATGVPGSICVQLTNPLPVDPVVDHSKSVTVDYAVADFGAGIGFTPVDSRAFNVPPNSTANYCIGWTPAGTGTLHRCVLVTLHQAGFRDMHSQRNIDIVRGVSSDLSTLDIPFQVGNPDGIPHNLKIIPTLVGIDPYWTPLITQNPGDPPPTILAGGNLLLHLRFVHNAPLSLLSASAGLPASFGFGAASQVQVSVLLDGRQVSGFTVQLEAPRTFLPEVSR